MRRHFLSLTTGQMCGDTVSDWQELIFYYPSERESNLTDKYPRRLQKKYLSHTWIQLHQSLCLVHGPRPPNKTPRLNPACCTVKKASFIKMYISATDPPFIIPWPFQSYPIHICFEETRKCDILQHTKHKCQCLPGPWIRVISHTKKSALSFILDPLHLTSYCHIYTVKCKFSIRGIVLSLNFVSRCI